MHAIEHAVEIARVSRRAKVEPIGAICRNCGCTNLIPVPASCRLCGANIAPTIADDANNQEEANGVQSSSTTAS